MVRGLFNNSLFLQILKKDVEKVEQNLFLKQKLLHYNQ